MNCIFCNIIQGDTPSYKVYEDQDVLAFLDIQPLTKGHCLIIPKKHSQDIFDIGESDLEKIIVVAKKISQKVKNSLGADGIRISQSNGKTAGQEVMHFHLHVIPRYENDGLSNNPALTTHSPKADAKELKDLAEKIHPVK